MKRVILDVDTGIDDALAITYALQSPELDVIGLTTCFGNNTLEKTTRNTLAIVEMAGKSVPVYKGADKPLKRETRDIPTHVHGEDGLGDCPTNEPLGKVEDEHAVDFIIRQVKQQPNEITLIPVGPLTNLAQAILKAPEIIPLFKEVIIMGGAVFVPGNVTQYSEANIYTDPEAAALVFASGLPITVVGLDVTMKTLLPDTVVADWRGRGTEKARFFANMTGFYMQAYETFQPGIGGCALHDPLAVGVAIDPDFVKKEAWHVEVVLEGEETGRTVASSVGEPKVLVCTDVQAERFLHHFVGRVL